MNNNIRVYCRWRPSRRPSPYFRIDHDAKNVEFVVPPDADKDAINASRGVLQRFKFDDIFDTDATQDEVFNIVAREAVDSALEGYNSTVFAYGQTGSGKTFTITGGPERYEDRGLIPRAVQRIFTAIKERPSMQYRASISYLEIYNEAGYDLLDASSENKALEELPRVTLQEDEEGAVHLRGLSMHPCTTEEEALNLLFLGDTNRAIAETPMNQASSRSHCIFTVSLESRKDGSSAVRHSKLHLVDLAGSERVHKTNASGQLFREATHINKSLHFLELVIVALYEARKGNRQHVPYRNSMMTSVLRDSLGGNCKTTMVATINPEPEHTDESISTCRFGQRVARITNEAHVNEETDPVLLVKALRARIVDLENELSLLRSGALGEGAAAAEPAELKEEEKSRITAVIRRWLAEPEDVPLDLRKLPGGYHGMLHALNCLKAAANGAGPLREGAAGKAATPAEDTTALLNALREEVKRLKGVVAAKEADLSAAVGLRAGGGPASQVAPEAATAGQQTSGGPGAPAVDRGAASAAPAPPGTAGAALVLANGQRVSLEVLRDRDASFELFRGMYPRTAALEDNMALLRATYAKAKSAAEIVSRSRAETTALKAAVEKHRVARAVEAVAAGTVTGGEAGGVPLEPDAAEGALLARLEGEKAAYRTSFAELKELKAEIEKMQRTLEQGRLRMQADFEGWYAACSARVAHLPPEPSGGAPPPPTPAAAPALNRSTASVASTAAGDSSEADIAAFYKARDELKALKAAGALSRAKAAVV